MSSAGTLNFKINFIRRVLESHRNEIEIRTEKDGERYLRRRVCGVCEGVCVCVQVFACCADVRLPFSAQYARCPLKENSLSHAY